MCGGGGGGSTNTIQKSDPWSGAQPYLTGGAATTQLKPGVTPTYSPGGYWGSTPTLNNPASDYVTTPGAQGIFPAAAAQYASNGWNPQMQAANTAQQGTIQERANQPASAYNLGQQTLNGGFDPNIQRVGNISGPQGITAQGVNPTAAMASLGAANPTAATQQLLSGQVNDPYLAQQAQAITNLSNKNLQQNVLPGLGQGAELAGQYGGTRQGIAEGVAAGNAQTGLDSSIANLYGNAYQQAQQNMYGTANNMSGLGLANAQSNSARNLSAQTSNASNDLTSQQYNATLGLNNNQQAMAAAAQRLANASQGLNFVNAGNTLQDYNYQNLQNLYNQPNQYNWGNLTNYASIIQPGSGIGGSSSSQGSSSSSPQANDAGLGLAGAGLYYKAVGANAAADTAAAAAAAAAASSAASYGAGAGAGALANAVWV